MPLKDAYLESQVLTADPMELVRLLYRGAGDAVHRAAAELAAGHILARSRQISKAYAILARLAVTLDHARGGALSRSLAELYDYMQRRLLEANRHQTVEPLAEVELLLATLLEGWDQVGTTSDHSVSAGNSCSPMGGDTSDYGGYPAAFMPSAAAGYASHSWSL
jgi:flagellar protein FliS